MEASPPPKLSPPPAHARSGGPECRIAADQERQVLAERERQILAERERELAGGHLRSRAGAREAEIDEIEARFEFALADELSFLSCDGAPHQLAMRLTHRRTRREHAVVICRRTAAGERWEVLCSPWFDDAADLYLRAVQERVARNRAVRLAGERAAEAASIRGLRRDAGGCDARSCGARGCGTQDCGVECGAQDWDAADGRE